MSFVKGFRGVRAFTSLATVALILSITGVVLDARASSDCNSTTNKDKYWDNDTCPSAKDHCCGKSDAPVLL